jgi:hypothetical protein
LFQVKADERTGNFRERSANLNQYTQTNHIPSELRESMQEHLRLHFDTENASDEQARRHCSAAEASAAPSECCTAVGQPWGLQGCARLPGMAGRPGTSLALSKPAAVTTPRHAS